MKVLLLQDVKTIGKKDEIHEVSDGYARNFLLPRKMAVAADAGALNVAKTKSDAKAHHAAEALAAAQALAEKIKDQTVELKEKGDAAGKLYGKITSKDVAAALSQKIGTEIDKRKVELSRDIKDFGTFTAVIKLHAGVSATFKVKVEEL